MNLWSGKFGSEYLKRNPKAIPQRGLFWSSLLQLLPSVRSVLEVGCGSGANLQWIEVYTDSPTGVDINPDSVKQAQESCKESLIVRARADKLPFPDEDFDLVFTAGVLIHQPPNKLVDVMQECIRCSREFIMCIEYEEDEFREIPYRGKRNALWAGPYSVLYQEHGLDKIDSGKLGKDEGWDDVTWTLLHK